MKTPRIILLCTFFFLLLFPFKHAKVLANDEINRDASDFLFEQTQSSSFWNKVHAIEFLYLGGNQARMKDLIQKDLLTFENTPEKRIGYWRCSYLAASTDKEREHYLNKLIGAYCDPDSPDKIHAAESLAKLKHSLKTLPLAVEADSAKNELLQAYIQWGMVLPSIPSEELDYDLFFSVINSENALCRKIMAYGSRYMGDFSESEWNRFAEIALNESLDSPCAVHLLHGILASCPDKEKQHNDIKERLYQLALTDNKSNQYESYIALGNWGSDEDLNFVTTAFLSAFPNQESSMSNEDQSDVKAAAAYAVLHLNPIKEKSAFTAIDWVILIFILGLMIWIGFIYSRKNKTADDYILGGGKMHSGMIGISLFATLLSTLSYLAYPGEMIKYGPVVFTGLLAFPVANWIVGRYIIPRIMSMKVKSAYEILEIKLGKGTRNLATIFFLSLRFLWMSTIVYATVDTALIPILGLSKSMVPLISLIIVLSTVIYTTLGGMKAVVVTDVLQTAIMFAGVIVTIGVIGWKVGSIQAFFDPSLFAHWEPIDFSINATKRMTVGNIFIMTLVWQVCTAGSDQMAIQRYLSTADAKTASRSYAISLAASCVIQLLLAVAGLTVMAYFTYFPEEMAIGATVFNDADTLFPRFISIGLPVGLTGLIAAAMMSAAMSSLSSGLNSSSTVIQEDIIKRNRKGKKYDQEADLRMIKRISAILGIIISFSCLLVSYVTGNLLDVVIKVVNLVVAPLFVLFFMALFIPFATNRGTVVGGIFSLLVAILIAFFEIFNIKVLWIMPAALIAGIVVATLFSYVESQLLTLKKKS